MIKLVKMRLQITYLLNVFIRRNYVIQQSTLFHRSEFIFIDIENNMMQCTKKHSTSKSRIQLPVQKCIIRIRNRQIFVFRFYAKWSNLRADNVSIDSFYLTAWWYHFFINNFLHENSNWSCCYCTGVLCVCMLFW